MQRAVALATLVLGAAASARPARADDSYLASHPDAPWWLSEVIELVGAYQPGFHAGPQGPQSLRSNDNDAAMAIDTFSAGYAPVAITAAVVSVEGVSLDGLGGGRGLGAPLDDAFVRNTSDSSAFYLASSFIDQVVPLTFGSAQRVATPRTPTNLLPTRPLRRLELRAGKLSAPTWFDGEQPSFASGALRNDAGWEYPADDHGYTAGAVLEYADRYVRLRVGEMLETTAPRSSSYDTTSLADARAEVAELAVSYCVLGYRGSARAGAFIDHADFGSYGAAIASFEVGEDEVPDVALHRIPGSERIGYLAGVEQQLPAQVLAFAGLAWSNSTTESFGATETDRSVRLGAHLPGAAWGRPADEIGLGVALGGLTELHRFYLAIGGTTALLGDGTLYYGLEQTTEAYYAAPIGFPWLVASAHLELIVHPGFDTLRGPIPVGLLHLTARI